MDTKEMDEEGHGVQPARAQSHGLVPVLVASGQRCNAPPRSAARMRAGPYTRQVGTLRVPRRGYGTQGALDGNSERGVT